MTVPEHYTREKSLDPALATMFAEDFAFDTKDTAVSHLEFHTEEKSVERHVLLLRDSSGVPISAMSYLVYDHLKDVKGERYFTRGDGGHIRRSQKHITDALSTLKLETGKASKTKRLIAEVTPEMPAVQIEALWVDPMVRKTGQAYNLGEHLAPFLQTRFEGKPCVVFGYIQAENTVGQKVATHFGMQRLPDVSVPLGVEEFQAPGGIYARILTYTS